VLYYDEVFTNPHVLARGMVEQTQHPVTGRFGTLGVTVKLSETAGAVRLPAPRLGEHGEEVLSRQDAAE
jgi:crotonobetainyl-CoA:carnitine CoA-transferase CaiB-like acyl-CoA transferase